MKQSRLFAVFIVAFGFSEMVIADSGCDKLAEMKSASQTKSVSAQEGSKVKQKLAHVQAADCMAAELRYLSERLTFRGARSDTSLRTVASMASDTTISYSPAAAYSSNAATPTAFLTRPVVHVNYIPRIRYTTNPINDTAPHLMDEVPVSNYQGSLATPIIYQTGYWNTSR